MLIFLIDEQTKTEINNKFDFIKSIWGEQFLIDFEVILTDNGKEFYGAEDIEYYDEKRKVHLFYCDPGASFQKGKVENNHEFIRRILPKGTSFENLTQNDVDLIMSHINSVPREELNSHSPHELAKLLIKDNIMEKINYQKINGNDIILTPNLLKK